MGAPAANFETVVDESTADERREQAIDELRTANECKRLAELVEANELEMQYREQALTSVANPQCKPTLEMLAENEDLPEPLRKEAGSLLQEMPDDSGSGS